MAHLEDDEGAVHTLQRPVLKAGFDEIVAGGRRRLNLRHGGLACDAVGTAPYCCDLGGGGASHDERRVQGQRKASRASAKGGSTGREGGGRDCMAASFPISTSRARANPGANPS